MDLPKYEGLTDSWKIRLIHQRARRHGFRPDQIPDALQEAMLVVLEFRYEPDRSNGASERTALTACVDNHFRKMKRSAARYQSRLEVLRGQRTVVEVDPIDPQAVDVAGVVEDLTPRERQVCQGLVLGRSKAELARQLNCGWHTVDRIVTRLRRRFERLGLAPGEEQ